MFCRIKIHYQLRILSVLCVDILTDLFLLEYQQVYWQDEEWGLLFSII